MFKSQWLSGDQRLSRCAAAAACVMATGGTPLAGVFRSDLPCKFRCKPEAYQARGGRELLS